MATSETKMNIRVSPKIEAGLGTVVSLLTLVAGVGSSAAVFLTAQDQEAALAPLGLSVVALYKFLDGRFGQARDAIKTTNTLMAATPQGPQAAVALTQGVTGDLLLVSLDAEAVLAAQRRQARKETER